MIVQLQTITNDRVAVVHNITAHELTIMDLEGMNSHTCIPGGMDFSLLFQDFAEGMHDDVDYATALQFFSPSLIPGT